ncbi:hypothetical protein, partial [Bradyrhizobium sp. Leo170]|uniref:hypothetical protein n=1 Tax=Bradyrhizobium sp. Leo170 TaxID=1571199 RepID=UPI001A90DB3F
RGQRSKPKHTPLPRPPTASRTVAILRWLTILPEADLRSVWQSVFANTHHDLFLRKLNNGPLSIDGLDSEFDLVAITNRIEEQTVLYLEVRSRTRAQAHGDPVVALVYLRDDSSQRLLRPCPRRQRGGKIVDLSGEDRLDRVTNRGSRRYIKRARRDMRRSKYRG